MGLAILQFEDYHQREIKGIKQDVEKIMNNTFDRGIEHLTTISNGILGFYMGSEMVENYEFDEFAKKILESDQHITNLYVIEDNEITNSFPHKEFLGKNILTTSIDLRMIENKHNLLLEFSHINNKRFVIAIPLGYFISDELMIYEPIKIVLVNSVDSNPIYSFSSDDRLIKYQENILTEKEASESIIFEQNTQLKKLNTENNFKLKYLIWSDRFQEKFGLESIVTLVLGISFTIIITILVYRSLKLQQNIQKKSEQLSISNEKLREAMRLRSEFSTMISHELKTPLTPIKGFCDLLLNPKVGALNEKQIEYIKEILQNTSQLEELISNLLAIRKIDLGKMLYSENDIQVDPLLKHVYENWIDSIKEKNCNILITGDKNLCVKGDENRIRQIFANLIRNAIDFIPKDSGIIEIGATGEKKMVVFSVKDNGVGISEKDQKELFKKFFQADKTMERKHGGTGLGLAICQGLTEGMKGYMWVESQLGKGTTFYFKLPSCTNIEKNT